LGFKTAKRICYIQTDSKDLGMKLKIVQNYLKMIVKKMMIQPLPTISIEVDENGKGTIKFRHTLRDYVEGEKQILTKSLN
jgi:hypothetical protein